MNIPHYGRTWLANRNVAQYSTSSRLMGKKSKGSRNNNSSSAASVIESAVHRISVSAVPGSSTSAVVSVDPEGVVRVRLAAAPRDGEANTELVRFVASVLGVRRSDVSLVAGHRDGIQ